MAVYYEEYEDLYKKKKMARIVITPFRLYFFLCVIFVGIGLGRKISGEDISLVSFMILPFVFCSSLILFFFLISIFGAALKKISESVNFSKKIKMTKEEAQKDSTLMVDLLEK